MKQTVTFTDFCDAFKSFGRENFSYDGLEALFNQLEEDEAQTGEELELDVISLCSTYQEYASLEEFQGDYSGYETLEAIEAATLVIYLNDDTTGESGFIIAGF